MSTVVVDDDDDVVDDDDDGDILFATHSLTVLFTCFLL